jgi:uncharacterized protein YbaA (DUF1428 family)
MSYIDGFVLAVPAANKVQYRDHASAVVPAFKRLGATRMVEGWGDDVPRGKQTDFYRATKLVDGEVPMFSWIEYPDRDTRMEAGRKMSEEFDEQSMKDMPFDAKRMIYGGFEALVDTGANGKPGYVEGMISPIPSTNKDAYRAAAEVQAPLVMQHGALRVVDTWGDDIPPGETTDFQRAVATKDGETVGFSFIEWPSKEVRDKAWEVLMKDSRMAPNPQLYDASRSIYGGFVPIVDQ